MKRHRTALVPALLPVILMARAAPVLAQAPAGPPEWPGAQFFAAHRQAFVERMEGGIAIFAAQPEIPRNDDAGYPYRQDSDFWYLTGFEEPESVLVLRPAAPGGQRAIYQIVLDASRRGSISSGRESGSATSTRRRPRSRPRA